MDLDGKNFFDHLSDFLEMIANFLCLFIFGEPLIA